MKVVILAGGMGTRISEESHLRPKPMIEIGGKPMLWHIMKLYTAHGLTDFVICAGYKGYMIKEYFANYSLHNSQITFDIKNNRMEVHSNNSEPWRVTVADTGEKTGTGGRIKKIAALLGDEDFCLTYGDGVGDVDLTALIRHHKKSGDWVTVTAVRPPGRFGVLQLDGSKVKSFSEKPQSDSDLINGGFFVCHPKALASVESESQMWEAEPLTNLTRQGRLGAYIHRGFWQPMDTLRDKNHLEELWSTGRAPWKNWD